ncbi:MAG: M16 family metallopeptidase, partial [Alphaproteobacteria bacterium]
AGGDGEIRGQEATMTHPTHPAMAAIPSPHLRRAVIYVFMAAFVAVLAAAGGIAPAAGKQAGRPNAAIQRVVSPGGIEAWLIEDHSNPILSAQFIFRGGAALDPAGREGLAGMASGLLDEGAGDLDSMTFQRRLEDMSVGMSFSAGFDSFSGSLRTLTEFREAAFELLRMALTEPRFDGEPVERIRSQLLAGLAESAEEPNYIAGRTWWSAAYPDHPYGRPRGGTVETIKAIAAEDLRGFVRRRLARDNLVIGVVGDVSAKELARLLDRTFGGLPRKAAPWRVAEASPKTVGGVKIVRRQIPQSVVIFGQRGLKRDDPDFYTAYVMNYLLGGGSFSSRLYTEIREKRGLAYSVYSSLNPMRHSALILGSVGTQNSRVKQTVDLVRAEWRRMAEDGISESELDAAKTFLTGSFPLRFNSSRRIASMLAGIQIENLGIDYLERRNSFIESVTVQDIGRVGRKWLDADALTFVVVGNPDGYTGG